MTFNQLREKVLKEHLYHEARAKATLEQLRLLDRFATIAARVEGKKAVNKTISREARERMSKAARARWARMRKEKA